MTSKPKAKGNRGEREICDFLSSLFGGNFMRVPNSGAFLGGINSQRAAFMSYNQQSLMRGDIIPSDDLPKLVIESKNYAKFPFHSLLSGKPIKQLDDWLTQTMTALSDDSVWFLVFKIDRKGAYVAFDKKLQAEFQLANYSEYLKSIIVTDFKELFTENKDKIRQLCSKADSSSD